MNLLAYAQEVMALARRKKLDDCELMITNYSALAAKITNHEVKLTLEQDVFSVAIRILKASAIGYVPLTEPDLAALDAGIDSAATDLRPFPLGRFAQIPGVLPETECFDARIAALLSQPRQVKDLARDLAEKAFQSPIETLEGSVAVQDEEKLVFTMHSAEPAFARRSGLIGMADVNSKDFDFFFSRRLPELAEVTDLGARIARSLPKTELTPEAMNVKGKTITVILHPYILETLLGTLVAEHVFATTAQAGLSRYRVGDTVATPNITLLDDGTAPYMADTFPTDDEGVPSQRTPVIDQGVFRSLLYDLATAKTANTVSTGNGKRRPILTESENEAPVRCSVRNLLLTPGTKPLEQMIAETNTGILLKFLLGVHTANKTTGDFTNSVYAGKLIRGGKIEALPEAGRWGLKGNALDILARPNELSAETINTGTAVLPYLKTELVVG